MALSLRDQNVSYRCLIVLPEHREDQHPILLQVSILSLRFHILPIQQILQVVAAFKHIAMWLLWVLIDLLLRMGVGLVLPIVSVNFNWFE